MTGRLLLETLAAGQPLPGRHVIVTAHPDDETISCGALLSLVADAQIVQLTTGAQTADVEVITRRRQERDAAFLAAGWTWPVTEGASAGREAHQHLRPLRQVVRAALEQADAVWTHPYENGHLDHDTAAWLVQQACPSGVLRLEFASYHATQRSQTFGDFWPDRRIARRQVQLTGAILARKQAAVAAYVSQAAILRKFPSLAIEAYRVAPTYDFAQPAAPPRCRWDVKRYQPSTAVWRQTVARAGRVAA